MVVPVRKLFLPAALVLLSASAPLRGIPALPERPASHVLDQARILTPEAVARLTTALQTAARDSSVEVYVMTVHAIEKDQLNPMGEALTRAWTKGAIGAVLLFDDQTGMVTIGTSEETDQKFSSLVLNMVLRDPLLAGRLKGLSPAKLERAALAVSEGLQALNAEATRKTRRRLFENCAVGFFLLLAIGLFTFRALKRPDTSDFDSLRDL